MTRLIELTDVAVDQRGHRQVWVAPNDLTGERIEAATLHLIRDDDQVSDGFVSVFGGVYSCQTCDAHPSYDPVTTTDPSDASEAQVSLRARTACPLPDGAPVVTSLRITSGRAVLAHDLRHAFGEALDLPHGDSPGYNAAAGQILHAHAHASLGAAHGCVLHGASLLRVGPEALGGTDSGHYVIADYDSDWDTNWDDLDEGERAAFFEQHPHLPATFDPSRDHLGSVDGPVWAWTLVDYTRWADALTDRGLDPAQVAEEQAARGSFQIIDMPVGHYLVTGHHTEAGHFGDNTHRPVHATLVRTGSG